MLLPTRISTLPRTLLLTSLLIATLISASYYYRALYSARRNVHDYVHPAQLSESGGDGYYKDGVDEDIYNAQKAHEAEVMKGSADQPGAQSFDSTQGFPGAADGGRYDAETGTLAAEVNSGSGSNSNSNSNSYPNAHLDHSPNTTPEVASWINNGGDDRTTSNADYDSPTHPDTSGVGVTHGNPDNLDWDTQEADSDTALVRPWDTDAASTSNDDSHSHDDDVDDYDGHGPASSHDTSSHTGSLAQEDQEDDADAIDVFWPTSSVSSASASASDAVEPSSSTSSSSAPAQMPAATPSSSTAGDDADYDDESASASTSPPLQYPSAAATNTQNIDAIDLAPKETGA